MAIKKPWRLIFKALSNPKYNVNESFQLHRKIITASRPYFKPFYNMLDRKVKTGNVSVPIRIFKPKLKSEDKPLDIIMFFHGGGWVTGNVDNYTSICGNMANQTNCVVVSVEYRLAPEYPFPEGLEDCYNVTKRIAATIKAANKSSKKRRLILSGDSAGGNLAAVVSLIARKTSDFTPDMQILFYPSCYNDYSEKSPFESVRLYGEDYVLTSKRIREYMELYVVDEKDLNSPLVAPLLAKDLTRQPDTLIITAEFDPLRDEAEEYGLRLEAAGNTVLVHRIEGALHGFLSLPKGSRIMEKVYDKVNEFLEDKGD